MSPRIGELFAGYGGLGMGVQAVFGGEVAWYSEIDRGALKILEHRFPGVPNVGDVTTADWSQVEPVDILTGGSPCQDLSHAGKRAGMTEGTRSNLWVAMREAIAQLRPGLVIWENVRGAASAEADSDLELCPGCMGDPGLRGPVLRALGRVVGDLAELGYVGRVHGVRASDVGAPHGRFRYFLVAYPKGDPGRLAHGDGDAAANAGRVQRRAGWSASAGEAPSGRPLSHPAGRDHESLMPTPSAQDGNGGRYNSEGHQSTLPGTVRELLPTPTSRDHKDGQIRREPHRPDDVDTLSRALTLLPTPAVNDMGAAYTPDTWDEWCAAQQAKHGNGNGHGKSLAIEAQRLLPTPQTSRAARGPRPLESRRPQGHQSELPDVVGDAATWGDYAAAIARWEHILGREAPAPTMTSSKGNPQLSPAFVEWMMGLPAGWVTDTPGITRNEALKALGNGVVPQQCAAALRTMLAWEMAS